MNKSTKIEWKNINDLIPYEHNAKQHSKTQIKNLKKSFEKYGWQNPILIDENNVIICGHGRILGAREAGIAEAPCIVCKDLSEDEIRDYRHLDNLLSEGDYIQEEFDIDLPDLSDFDFSEIDINIDLDGGDDEEQTEIVEDEVPEEAEARCKLGDLWQLGNHRLICGDSTDPEVIARLMGGGKADMVFTDPPYGVAIGDKNKALNKIQRSGRCTENIENDAIGESELYEILKTAFVNVRENCADDAVYYVTSPQGGSLGLMMMMMMRDAGLEVRHILMWEKNSATFSIGRLDYDYQHEPIFYTWTKSHHNFRNGEYRTTVWKYDKPRKNDLHPTMKPVALVANAIADGTTEGMSVLDAFGGSGTTIIACEQMNRRGFMVELDPHYCDVIIQRWENLTGETAVKIDD